MLNEQCQSLTPSGVLQVYQQVLNEQCQSLTPSGVLQVYQQVLNETCQSLTPSGVLQVYQQVLNETCQSLTPSGVLQVYQQVLNETCQSLTPSGVLQVYQQVLNEKCQSLTPGVVLQVYQQVLNEQCQSLMESLVSSIAADRSAMENVTSNGDVNKLMYRVNGVRHHSSFSPLLVLQHMCKSHINHGIVCFNVGVVLQRQLCCVVKFYISTRVDIPMHFLENNYRCNLIHIKLATLLLAL